MSNEIDKIVKIILVCKDTEGDDLAISYDIPESNTTSVSMECSMYSPPTLNITASVGKYTIHKPNDGLDDSSEALDEFLKQFAKE